VAAPSKKITRACSALGAAWLALAACDPNVVIGARWRTGAAGTAADTGGAPPVSGSGGVAATGAPAVAGDTMGATAGEPSMMVGGAGGDAGIGAAGEPAVAPIFFDNQQNGSLMQWDEPTSDADAGGYYADPGFPNPAFTATPAHSGDGSVKVVIDTTTTDQISRLYRRVTDNHDAYYSAWFYLNEDHTPSVWWSIFLFRAVQDRNNSIDLWSVDLVRTAESTLTVALFDHQYQNGKGRTVDSQLQPAPVVPVKVWFQIQAHLVQSAGQPSQLTLWLNGQQFMNLDMATTAPDMQPLYWVIGNGGSKMNPPKSTIFIDDAQISTSFVRP
jgi:hypothetical protein